MSLIPKLQTLAKEQSDIAALWIYGSRARGDYRADSDYDLAVGFTDWFEDPLERRLRPELLAEQWREALELPAEALSVVDIAIAPIPLGIAILSDGRLLVDKNPQIRLSLESRILSRWELDYQYYQQRSRAL